VAYFNLGCAYYLLGEFGRAADAFTRACKLLDGAERAQAFYNLGNALAKQGKLLEALSAYRSTLRLTPEDDDARYNYVLVESWMRRSPGGESRQEPAPRHRLAPDDARRMLDELVAGLRVGDRRAALGSPLDR
jgi:Ca-activated chloride channel family protein